jgi:hypothetical protein
MRWLLWIGLAACGNPPQHVRGDEGVPLQRATPAPKVRWDGDKLVTTGLPAIARGGEVAVVAPRDPDGERGNPNLRIFVRDRTDKPVATIDVMTGAEFDTLVHGGVPSPELTRRITAANLELARLHGLHDLVTMHPLELQPVTSGDRHLAIGDGIDVDWDDDHLHVFSHNANHALVTLDGHAWLARSETCVNPAFLANVFHVEAINAVVIDLSYHGTDSCPEPGDQQHMVVW